MFGSGLWPVVQRELRETARRPINHWLRVGGGLCGVIIFCSVTAQTPTAILGAELFHNIHVLLLCLICAFVPALAADSIARERREGTLGLLFMTPLTASGIVLGKVLAQVLRVLTLWLAVMPLLTIPFLYGGVTWTDVAGFLIIELSVGMLCLAAGLLATSLTDHRLIAFILAFLFMGAFVDGSLKYQQWQTASSAPVRMPGRRLVISGGLYYFTVPARVVVPTAGRFGFTSRLSPAGMLAEDFALAATILLAALRFAGWRVEHSWQDKIPSVRQANLLKRYCTPLFVQWFARRMRRTLEWNPIAWLQQYSWKARLSKWGLCMLFLVLECDALDRTAPSDIGRLVTALLLILAAAYTFAGVNGFLQDKKSGALELILVSPLSVKQIIFGRVWGLWKQFLPCVLLLAGSDIAVQVMLPQGDFFSYGNEWDTDWSWIMMENLEVAAIYLTLPVVATCFALSARNLLVASAQTVAVVFVPALVLFLRYRVYEALHISPTVGWVAIDLEALGEVVPLPPLQVWILAAHAASALWAYKYLCRSLGRRSYAY